MKLYDDLISPIGTFVAGTAVLAAGVALIAMLIGFPIKWVWNAVMPDVFGLPVITFWQAVLLYLVANLIFPSSMVTSDKAK
jgi:hypothetical protein